MTRTFHVTPAKLEALSAYLKGHGLVLDPSAASGSAIQDGWQIHWTVTADALTVTVEKHPFGEENFFWRKLGDLLA